MNGAHRDAWPGLDAVLAALRTEPSRTPSVIVTVYGDAILHRGGCLALADLLALMARLGIGEGVVRTAISRLKGDGLLEGRRAGRRSAYALTAEGAAQCRAAGPVIYGDAAAPWDGHLHLAFPEAGADRSGLEAAGFALLAPGVLVSPGAAPAGMPSLQAAGQAGTLRLLAARAWPIETLAALYRGFLELFAGLEAEAGLSPLAAMAGRVVLIHAWRRIALRDPHLPAALLPDDWPGATARTRCMALYAALRGPSEAWLDGASSLAGGLPAGDGGWRFAPGACF